MSGPQSFLTIGAMALLALLGTGREKIPDGINYILLAHGTSIGDTWKLLGTNLSVSELVRRSVPEGERVYLVICDENTKRNIAGLEGVELISGRPPLSSSDAAKLAMMEYQNDPLVMGANIPGNLAANGAVMIPAALAKEQAYRKIPCM